MPEALTEKDGPNEEYVIVETPPGARGAPADDDTPPQGTPKGAAADPDADLDDERPHNDDDGAHEGADDAEREAIRERRRLEKQERKLRRDEAIKRDKLELDFLRKRNDDLERRLTAQEQRSHQSDLRGLDAEIKRAQEEAEMADKVIAKAVAAGNGDDVAQALKYRDAAIQRAQQLTAQKQQAAAAPPAPAQQGVDDLAIAYAQRFVKDLPWYDPQGRDEDSAIVLAIDQAMARDGYDPRSEEYWDELRTRVQRRLPDRFASKQNNTQTREERTPRGGPAVGSGREHAPATTRREVYISPERKQALIDAGVWDDPVLRAKYVKRYAEYDRANRA